MSDLEMSNALFTQEQLTQVLETTESIPYTGVARSFFTVDTSIMPWAESYQTSARTSPGLEAGIIGYHSILPNVLKFGKKSVTSPVVPLGDAVVYTIQDVSNSQAFGVPLDSMRLRAVAEGVYRKEDRITFRGDVSTGVYGIGNHPQISQVVVPASGNLNGYTNASTWLAKDINLIVREFGDLLRLQGELCEAVGAPEVDTMVLPSTVLTYLTTTFTTPANPTTTLYDVLARSFPRISFTGTALMNSIPLASLNFASNSAALLYNRGSALSVVIPRDITLEPTQAVDLKLSTPAHSRFGGIRVFFPESVLLLVGI